MRSPVACASSSARAGVLPTATYDFTGTVTGFTNTGGLFPGVTAGDTFEVQVVVDTAFPGTGGNGFESYKQAAPGDAFPVESVSLELNDGPPIEISGTSHMTEQGPVNAVAIEYNLALGGSLVDELAIGMTGRQSNGDPGEFSVTAIDQTFGAPSGFTTSLRLGAPLGPTPANAINIQEGGMPLDFSVCANAACSTQSAIYGSLSKIAVASAPLPNAFWLMLGGLTIMAARLGAAKLRRE